MHQFTLIPVDFNPFEGNIEIESVVPTNEPQRDMWISCVLGGSESNLAYNESVSLNLTGVINLTYFEEAIRQVVSRHQAIRSTVNADGTQLIILKNMQIPIVIKDISAAKNQDLLIEDFISQEMEHEFDLREGPLCRFFLHQRNAHHVLFTIVAHHIIADGWSLRVILEDLSKFYNAQIKGTPPLLEPAPQISDYAAYQDYFSTTDAYLETKKFWQNRYQEPVPVLRLPLDFPRPAVRTYKAKRVDYRLPLELIEQLKTIGARAGCSIVNTMLSVFEVFLYQQTRQADLVVCLPAAGQAATAHHGLVGHCVNLLAIRSIVPSEKSFPEFLKLGRNDFFDAFEHQNFTFGQLTRLLNIKRDLSRIPLSPVIFNIDTGMDKSVQFEQMDCRLISNPRAYETFEIFLNITVANHEFVCEWSFNTQLFREETIRKMASSFEKLIRSVVENPAVPIKNLSSSDTNTLIAQLNSWNDTANSYPKDSNLSILIDQTATLFPDKTAIVCNDEKISYRELIDQSNQLSHWLVSYGISPGDIIGLATERSIKMVISLLAIMKAGAVYLPLDPEYPQDRLLYMLEDANAKILMTSETYSGRLATGIPEINIERVWPELRNRNAESGAQLARGTDLVYILYTSGSTGKPKGVKISHRNMVNFLQAMQSVPGINADDRVLAITTISFDIAGLELYLPLMTGAELTLCSTESAKDGRILLELIEERNITLMQATPSTWRMMLESGWNKKFQLKALIGGEPLSKELADKLLGKTSELWNMYGPTETTVWSSLKQITGKDLIITVGKPIQNTQLYILDQALQPVPRGNTGEVFIGGDGVSPGYLNRPELSKERFIHDPFSPHAGAKLYKTGDSGMFLENGEVQLHGRIDEQIKVRGYRIEPGEIETSLLKLENIKQATVIAGPSPRGDQRLIAYIVRIHEDIRTDHNQLDVPKSTIQIWKDALKTHLPDYMIPEDFVVLSALPLTLNNKIDKKSLPVPELKHPGSKTGRLTSISKNEKLVADIWDDVLGIKNIAVEDDFFDLGGYSLLAVKVMTAIEQKTGKRLPLATLFENSTIEKLAKKLDGEQQETIWDALVPIKPKGKKDPVFMVHGGGLNVLIYQSISKLLDEEQPVYGLQALGLNREMEISTSVEGIAKAYISEIIELDANGPYRLVGYSMGGLIAFEMAKQLIEMGKEIKFLGVIDTYARTNDPEEFIPRLKTKIKRQFKKFPFIVRSFIKYPAETLLYQLDFFWYKIKSLFTNADQSDNEYFNAREEEIFGIYYSAHQRYVLQPVDVKVSLFRVEKRIYYLDDLVYLGWDKFAKKGVDIHIVPGDHENFLNPPMDRNFSDILQSAIDH